MKKMILSLVAVLAMSVSSFAANNNNINVPEKSMIAVENYLNLDGYQSTVAKQAGISFQKAVEEGVKSENKQQVKDALRQNLRVMHRTLSQEQYKKYIKALNQTIVNNHLQEYVK